MIVTKNAMYLHIPKTAGMWVADALKPIVQTQSLHGIPAEQPAQPYVFTFVRNPWDWYVSFYQFHATGSETFNLSFSPLGRAMVDDTSFDEFIHNSVDPTIKYKLRILNYIKLDLWANENSPAWLQEMFTSWLDSKEGLYQHFCDTYCKYATHVGQFENLRDDLLEMVTMTGELTPKVLTNIVENPPINVTSEPRNYYTYYTDDLAECVKQSSIKLIGEHHYEFQNIVYCCTPRR